MAIMVSGTSFDKERQKNKISDNTAVSFDVGKNRVQQNAAGEGFSVTPIRTQSTPQVPAVGGVARGNIGATQPAKPPQNSFNAGQIGVRDALRKVGFQNDLIGWDNGSVTYDGKHLMTPEINNDGTTRTNTENFISSVNNYYKNNGQDEQLQAVNTSAVSGLGLANAVQYNDNGVTIGGIPVENVIISNGISYAPRSSILAAARQYKSQNNVAKAMEDYDAYNKEYGDDANEIEQAMRNYDKFSYNPEEDPAYLAYKEQYIKNAQKAYDDTWGRQVGRTGGFANSAAMAQSDQAYYDHMSELDSIIPTLMDKAYGRYTDDYNRLGQQLDMYGNPLEQYGMKVSARDYDNKMVQDALNSAYDRQLDNRAIFENDRDFEYNKSQDEWNQNFDLSQYKDEQNKYWYENMTFRLPAELRTQENFDIAYELAYMDLMYARDTYEMNMAIKELQKLQEGAKLEGLEYDNALTIEKINQVKNSD